MGQSWQPRLAKAGTYDQRWLDTRHPGLPKDFDFSYWNGAPEDQQIPYPAPGLRFELKGLHPQGVISGQIPAHQAVVLLRMVDGALVPQVTAQLADAAQVVPSVKANGRPLVVLTRSFIPKTIGDEAGTAKGVESGTVADICEPLEHSSSVRVGGFCALRHDDKFHMNSKNTTGKIVGQSSSTNKSASESNPKVVPETPEEKSGWELLAESYRLQTEYRRNLLDDISAFFARSRAWGQTPEGIGIMAAHTANVESRAQAENLRRYVEENAGAEGLAAFDRTYVKGYSVLAEVLPMYLAAASVVSTGGKLGGAPDE